MEHGRAGRSRPFSRAGGAVGDLDRFLFFSDAVFAIALTLLAIDLRLPVGSVIDSSRDLTRALLDLWPHFFSFAVGFMVIVLFWAGHLRAFSHLRRIDGGLIGLNALFLFFVAALPFATAVLGNHGDLAAATIFFGLVAGATGVCSTFSWVYAARWRRLTTEEITPAVARRVTVHAALAPAVMLLSLPLALVHPRIPQVLWLAIWPAQLIQLRGLSR